MDFDILIATRNRQAALKLSLPLMLSQSRLPRRVIVVDSSDDVKQTEETLAEISASAPKNIDFQLHPTEPGTSFQRNFGLRHVQSPVVLIPDDDSMWFPGVAEALMRVYERDTDGIIGGVGGEQTLTSPFSWRSSKKENHAEMAAEGPLIRRISRPFKSMESRLFPDPFFIEALDRYRNRPKPAWLDEENAVLSATMTGFRMSFRTELIRKTGFDEALGRYALFEDHDACLGVLDGHSIARARNALVFHQVFGDTRAAPREMGIMHILNRAYITYKHSRPGSLARRRLRRFCSYKLLRYFPRACTRNGVERLLGALKAFFLMPLLDGLSGGELRDRYLELRKRCIEEKKE